MLRAFSKRVRPNGDISFTPPLLLQGKMYKLVDVRIEEVRGDGTVQSLSRKTDHNITLDEQKILNAVSGGSFFGEIASFKLNQYINVFTEIQIRNDVVMSSLPDDTQFIYTFLFEDSDVRELKKRIAEFEKASETLKAKL